MSEIEIDIEVEIFLIWILIPISLPSTKKAKDPTMNSEQRDNNFYHYLDFLTIFKGRWPL